MRPDSGVLVTDEQRCGLRERGFFFTDVLFSAEELEPIRHECMRLYRASLDEIPESDQVRRQKQRLRPFLPGPHERSEIIARFQRHRVFQELTRQIVGPDVDQTWSQGCFKLPDEDGLTRFPFHQDGKFALLDPQESVLSCFLALAPLSQENGTLLFAADPAQTLFPHTWDARLEWWSCSVDGMEIVPAAFRPGAMVVYRLLTPHGSPPNLTDEIREAFSIGFSAPGIRLAETGALFGDQRAFLRDGQLV